MSPGGTFPVDNSKIRRSERRRVGFGGSGGIDGFGGIDGYKKPPRLKRGGYPIKSLRCRGKPFANCLGSGSAHET